MNIIQIIGGIGNQMFQYALYRMMGAKYGKENVYYESFYAQPHHDGFVLEDVFNIHKNPIEDIATLETLTHFQENTWPDYNPVVPDKVDTYLCGNWQNIKYFPDESVLRKELSFKQELDDKNKKILEDIKECDSVSIHVRRGDFLHDGLAHFFPTWFNYYGLASSYMRSALKSTPKFYVFSDDIAWCRQNILGPATFVEQKKGESWKDMMLMSNCKHNIMTNSTFSWWGAWLNNNPDKIVITPKVWFLNAPEQTDLITLDEWIKL